MAQLIATNQLTLTNLKEKAIDRTEISFWHGLSATKRPLGVFDCAFRDHYFGNEFNVTSGKTYTVRVIAKQTKGSIRLAGGIWYTAMTSGNAWDGYASFTLVGEASEDGLGVYERKFVVASGKTKAKIYIQIEQTAENGYPTAWRIYDGQVFDENGQPLVTDQNSYGALTSPMATPNGTYIWKRTITYYTDGTSDTIWEYSGVGAKGEKGERGNDGIAGAPGVGIQSTTSTYGLSANETTQPTSWSATVPTLVKGQYLWTKNVWTYTDGRTETGYTKTYIPKDGNDGANGIAGKDGVGISSTTITYASSSSGTTVPTSGWSASVPNATPGQYLWTKTVWTYTDSTNETGYSVARMGTDGQTPYIHWAYSDNADGTGLTTSDSGQRYIGNYSDYTQADSTDNTKYRWADRWAKIEVGGENLIDRTSEPFIMGYGITNTTWNPNTKRTRLDFTSSVNRAITGEILPQGDIFFESQNLILKKGGKYTQAIRFSTDAPVLSLNAAMITWFHKVVATGTLSHYPKPATIVNTGPNEYIIYSSITWDRENAKIRAFDIQNLHLAIDFRNKGTYIEFYQPKLENGTVYTAYSISHNDRDAELGTKADQELTQQQLNMLIEKAQLMQTELEAKVAMETLSDLERAYNAYVEANDKAVAKSQADLIEAGRRVDAMVETLGGLSKTKKFIDTYIKEANEGIVIGTNDNVSQIRVTYDRIAMYSAGEEVMYISQGVIHIDNGVFTKTLQIGRFRTEQHQTNLDINVCRYVG
ncbi:hypothetical protein MKL27_05535 [Streptococcus suis]|nr:hypothetical protein [Streptococcus suis]